MGQLKQLITDICIGVGMDEGGRAHFVVEVEELTHRIVGLRESLLSLQAGLMAREEEQARVAKAVEDAKQVVEESSTALLAASPAEVLAELGAEERVEQLSGLRDQLLRLSQAECHLANLPPPSPASTALVPSQNSGERVAATLHLWQRVFEDTLARYHRLSSSLVGEDMALEVWRSQLEAVNKKPKHVPALTYSQVGETMREVALQRSLLAQSQQLMLRMPGPEVAQLTEQSSEALDLLESWSKQLRSRQAAWDQHAIKAEHLAAWLREMEKEKAKLNLKHVALRRVGKVLKRIEELLERVPAGEQMLKDVAGGQASLAADSFHPTALSSFRVQLHSIQERISSLQAGLRTWQDHLHRLQRLASECKEQEGQAAAVMDEQAKVVMAPLPDSAVAADEDFRRCEAALQRLDALTPELEALAAVQDELKEAVSPSDIKQTTQRAWLLWQRQADLRHQVALRMQELEGRSALLSLFRAQNFRFLEWTEITTVKLDNVDASGLNLGLQAEIASKEQELRWLERAATQLEGEDKAEVEVAAAQSRKSYEEVTSLLKALIAKQRNSINAQVALEDDLREFKLWLTQFETHVKKPWNQGGTSEAEYLAASQVQASLDRELNQQSGRVSSLLNDGEVLLLSSPSNQLALQLSEVEESWTSVCNLSSSRAQLLESTWGRWQQLLGPGGRLLAWLNNKNEEASIESNKIRLSDSTEKQKELDVILMEQKEKEPSLQDLNSLYDNLAKEGSLDASGDLRVLHGRINEAWKNLSCNTTTLIRTLTEVFAMFESLMKLKESEMTLLRQLDAEVTEVQVSSTMDDEEKRRRLQIAQRSIKERADNVQKAKKKMDAIKDTVHAEDKTILVQNHEELTALYEDVKTRILHLTEEFCVEAEKEKGQERQLMVTVHKAKKLEKRGFFGKGDHYVVLTIGDKQYRSETINNNQDPEWQFKSTVKLNDGMPNKIKLEVFDDDIGKDDYLGQATIDISQDQLEETWIPLQGCKSGAVLVSITTDLEDPIKFEQNRGIQVDTLPPDSGFVSESSEFSRRVAVCRANIVKLEQSLDITEDSELLYAELNECRSSLEMCRIYLGTTEESNTVLAELGSLILLLEARINEKTGNDNTR